MPFTFSQLVVWLVVGVLAGSLVSLIVTGSREGLGRWTGLGIGLIGALIGGALFRFFNILPGLESLSISLRDVVAAFIGALIFLAILWLVKEEPGLSALVKAGRPRGAELHPRALVIRRGRTL